MARQISVSARWEALRDGECFFVVCQDPIGAQKKVVELGYEARKKAPVAFVGLHRGMLGLLCFRSSTKTRFIERRLRTVEPDWSSPS
jgi:hypothetical protein